MAYNDRYRWMVPQAILQLVDATKGTLDRPTKLRELVEAGLRADELTHARQEVDASLADVPGEPFVIEADRSIPPGTPPGKLIVHGWTDIPADKARKIEAEIAAELAAIKSAQQRCLEQASEEAAPTATWKPTGQDVVAIAKSVAPFAGKMPEVDAATWGPAVKLSDTEPSTGTEMTFANVEALNDFVNGLTVQPQEEDDPMAAFGDLLEGDEDGQ